MGSIRGLGRSGLVLMALLALIGLTACSGTASSGPATLTIYSGRNEQLVKPILDRFATDTGINIQVRYGDSAELAATILEEGDKSPADVFFSQDAGSLGALSKAGLLRPLPERLLNKVNVGFRSQKGEWVGTSARARVLAYNTSKLKPEDLPDSVLALTEPKWKDRVGWAPPNASFQAFVTAMRITQGEAATRAWLEGMKRNGVRSYPNNISIVDAVGRGEIDVGLVNHYYLYSFLRERGESFPVRNYHPRGGGVDAMVNVAGAGILKTSKQTAAAEHFVEFLLDKIAQEYFVAQTFEYPVVGGINPYPGVDPLGSFKAPQLDLSNLADLQGTLKLLRDVGVL